MNGWIKYFAFGRPEYGTDKDVINKSASWSRGRLSEMIAAELWHNDLRVVRIVGPGEYHQSDDFSVSLHYSKPDRIIRRLQFLIQPQHDFVVGYMQSNTIDAYLTNSEVMHSDKQYSLFCGLHSNTGEWLTVEYDIKYDKIGMYVSKEQL